MSFKLNLGCGGDWSVNGWYGIDSSSSAFIWQSSKEKKFFDIDIKQGLPFPDNSVDVVFSSHSLEHFTYSEAVTLLFEIYRILKIGAPLCLVVPDMDIYIKKLLERDDSFLNTPSIIGGIPKNNLTDNFLMNFYSDPSFNNTCHKYAYNFENLSSILQMTGFNDIAKVGFHDFSYWPELKESAFQSPIDCVKQFSLSVQARKKDLLENFRDKAEYKDATRHARFRASESKLESELCNILIREEAAQHNIETLEKKVLSVENLNLDLSGSLRSLQQEAQQLREIIADKTITITATANHNDQLNQVLIALRQEITAKNEKLQESIAAEISQKNSTESIISDLSARLAFAEHKLAAIERSTSWRIMAIPRQFFIRFSTSRQSFRKVAKIIYWTVTLQLRQKISQTIAQRANRVKLKDALSNKIHTNNLTPEQFRLIEFCLDAPEHYIHSGPSISIILPTYNTPQNYLIAVLDSIKNQSYKNWELCIVDDASTTKHVGKILRSYAKRDSRIKLQFNPSNLGIASTSQRALEMTTGEYVAIVDHDDLLVPHALAVVVKKIISDPSVDFIYSDYALINEREELTSAALKPAWSPEFFISTNYVAHFKTIRKKALDLVEGFKNTPHLAQDTGLILKLMLANAKFAHLPGILYFWRAHLNSVASSTRAKPAITEAALSAINSYLEHKKIPATAIWPKQFQEAGLGAFKLDFLESARRSTALIIPISKENLDKKALENLINSIPSRDNLTIHVIGINQELPILNNKSALTHTVSSQAQFDQLLSNLEAEVFVFLSPLSRIVSENWLTEICGYLSASPFIGVVGGKILGPQNQVLLGGLVLNSELQVIGKGLSDKDTGYWLNNLIASNVDAVSSQLMATTKIAYRQVGGLPVFSYGDMAGIAYSLKLKNAGYRAVLNPWSKIIVEKTDLFPSDLLTLLKREFGEALHDNYYHPYFIADPLYKIA